MAFNIQANIGADGSGFFRELNRVKAAANNMGGSLVAGFGVPLGAAAAAGAITLLARKTLEYGGHLTDLESQLGVSTDALQELDYAASKNGASLEDVTSALQKLGVARAEALEMGGPKLDSFRALGISAEQLKSARLEDLFKAIGRSVRDSSDVQLVLADSIELMGKSSGKLLPAMRADLELAAEEARRMGLVIDNEVLQKLDEMGDKADATGKRLLAAFAPFITFVMEGVDTMLDGFSTFGSFAARWGEMIGKISAGVPIRQAIDEKDAGIKADLDAIAARQDARRASRATAPTGGDGLRFRGEGRAAGSAAKEAEKILSLREKIEKMDRDALPIAERRKAVEEEIARLKQEQADLAANGLDEVRQLEIEVKTRELQKEVEKGGKTEASKFNDDSLSKRGLFVGGAPSSVTVAPLTGQQASREFSRIVESVQRAIAAIDRNGSATTQAVRDVL